MPDITWLERNRTSQRGFTLMEILIVVVILGILAAMVVPQFTSASETARANSTQSMLKSLRAQLELYKVHHNENYPAIDQLWDAMLQATDDNGNIVADGPHGPYLQKPPLNIYTSSTGVAALGQGTANDGWEYDERTGEIHAVGFDERTGTFSLEVPTGD